MKRALLALLVLVANGCAYGSAPAGEYSVAGSARGIQGDGILVSDASGASVFVGSDGRFVIESSFADGAAYDIAVESTVGDAPLRCSVKRGTGVVRSADVDDVAISCRPATFTVNGEVTGLAENDVVILALRGEEIALARDGRFTFFAETPAGAPYAVSITQAPDGATCTLANATGVIRTRDVDDVLVTCARRVAEAP